MTFITNLWTWFDGKKVNIGAVLLFLSTLATQWLIGVNHYDPHWLDTVILNLNYIGGLLTAGGLIHQQVKIVAAKKIVQNGGTPPPTTQS